MSGESAAAVRHIVAELAVHMTCELGEGPRWDPSQDRLLFVDIIDGHLHSTRPDGSSISDPDAVTTVDVGQSLGAVNPAVDGGLVLAMRDGIFLSDADGSSIRLLAPIEEELPTNRMNDAACDSQGRLWAGTTSYRAELEAGTLYRIDPDGSVVPVLADLTISNGLGWSPDGRRMYYVDSPTRRVDVMDFDGEHGAIRDRRCFVDVAEVPGVPDGMAIDDDGGVWVAFWGGAQVRRYSQEGVLTAIVELPVPQPTSCAFGGPDRQVLYITSARAGLSQGEIDAAPLSGSIFRCQPGYRGLPTNLFGQNSTVCRTRQT